MVQAKALNKDVHVARSIDCVRNGQVHCSVVNTGTRICPEAHSSISTWPTTRKSAIKRKKKVSWEDEMAKAINLCEEMDKLEQDGITQILLEGMGHQTENQRNTLFKRITPLYRGKLRCQRWLETK